MIAGKALRKYLATNSAKDPLRAQKKKINDSPQDSKIKNTSLSKAKTDRLISPNVSSHNYSHLLKPTVYFTFIQYQNYSKTLQKSSDFLELRNIKSNSKSTERLLNVLKEQQGKAGKSLTNGSDFQFTSPKTKKVSEISKKKDMSIESFHSKLNGDSIQKVTSFETKKKKEENSFLLGNNLKTDTKSSNNRQENHIDNCSKVKKNIAQLLEKSKANEISRTRRGITTNNFINPGQSSSLKIFEKLNHQEKGTKESEIKFKTKIESSNNSKYSFRANTPTKEIRYKLNTEPSEDTLKGKSYVLDKGLKKKTSSKGVKSVQRMKEILQTKISEQSQSSSRRINSSKKDFSYCKSQTGRSYREPSSDRVSKLHYAEENLRAFLQRGHREVQSRTFDFSKNLSNFVDLLNSLGKVHKEHKNLFATLSSIIELNMEKILEEFSDLKDLLMDQKEEVDKVRELDSENLYLMAKINKAVKEAKAATEDYNRIVDHLDSQGVPQFDSLCRENEKLKSSLSSKLQLIEENKEKEKKLMKLFYVLRKMEIDVDTIFKEKVFEGNETTFKLN